jgi:GMP synthase (glutamine-hydrolysing)
MRIGILQTGRSPDELRDQHGDYDGMFRRLLDGKGLEFATYAVLDGVLPASVHDAEGWLITGSRFGVYEDHDWIPRLENFLREAYAQSVPIVGICFGHQILAQALGGKVEKFAGGWSVGSVSYNLDGFPDGARVLAWHQDQVIEPPADATVVGSTPFCRYAALAYGERAYSIQPHPEFDARFVADLIEARRAILPEEIAQQARQGLDLETSSSEIAERITTFFRHARQDP